jgi:sRNA-binding carbon storage regulator CsrA
MLISRSVGQSILVSDSFLVTVSKITLDGVDVIVIDQWNLSKSTYCLEVGKRLDFALGMKFTLAEVVGANALLGFEVPSDVPLWREEILDAHRR